MAPQRLAAVHAQRRAGDEARRRRREEHDRRRDFLDGAGALERRLRDTALDVEVGDILVLQNAGPNAPEAMPEAGYLPIPKKLAQKGIKDMIRVSDARMSGTAFGTIVLHVTPDTGAPSR